MKKFLSILLSFILIFFSGCVEKNKEVNSQEGIRDYLIYNMESMPKDLILLDNNSLREEDLILTLFDGLVGLDKNNNIIPELAEKWEVSKDGLEYKFYIKDNVSWSNDKRITAKDFEEFFRDILIYCRDNNFKINELNCIYGVKDYFKNGNLDNVAIKAKDNNTLEIRLNYSSPCFLSILSKPKYKLRKVQEENKVYKENYNGICYTGAFIINKIENDKITVVKNNKYWDEKNININKIVFKSIGKSEAALAALKTSKLDLFVNPPISEMSNLNNEGLVSKKLSLEMGSIVFNKREYIDLNLRKAVSYIINRKDICSQMLYNSAVPAMAYVPNNISENDDISYSKNYFNINSNIEKGKEYLNKSKYVKDKRELKFICIEDPTYNRICQSLVNELKEKLDINITLINCRDEEELKRIMKDGKYDLAFTKNKAENNSPLFFLSNFNVQYNDYMNILEKIKVEKNLWKNREYINKAQDLLFKDLDIIPLCFFYNIICKKNRVQGEYLTLYGNVIIKKATLAPYN